jgi:membrane protease YdiL (CAAX protease family)
MLKKVLAFPLTRLVLAILFLAGAGILCNILFKRFHGYIQTPATIAVIGLAYWGYVHLIERRPVSELSLPGAASEFAIGSIITTSLSLAVFGLLWVWGCYHVVGVNPWTSAIPALYVAVLSGFVEEVLLRGVLFRIMEEGLGTWIALVFSALLFGALHLMNKNATMVGALAIALTGGVLLCAGFIMTRRLWMPIGMHFAWNFLEAGVFGAAVSGQEVHGILRSRLDGPALISGGVFGPEASLITMALGLSLGAWLTLRAKSQGKFLPPYWRRTAHFNV